MNHWCYFLWVIDVFLEGIHPDTTQTQLCLAFEIKQRIIWDGIMKKYIVLI